LPSFIVRFLATALIQRELEVYVQLYVSNISRWVLR
jgi:hypothetical protein